MPSNPNKVAGGGSLKIDSVVLHCEELSFSFGGGDNEPKSALDSDCVGFVEKKGPPLIKAKAILVPPWTLKKLQDILDSTIEAQGAQAAGIFRHAFRTKKPEYNTADGTVDLEFSARSATPK